MNAGTCWEQEYNRPNGLSVEKAPKSDLYLFTFTFTLQLPFQPSPEAHPASHTIDTAALFSMVKRPESNTDHPPQTDVEVHTRQSHARTPLLCFHVTLHGEFHVYRACPM